MFQCNKCNKEYKTENRLYNHNRKMPNCINKCLICQKQFSSKQSLNNHMILIKCKRKYECTRCGKLCNTTHNLRIHDIKCEKTLGNSSSNLLNDKIKNELVDVIQKIPDDKNVNIVINNHINNNVINNNNNNNNYNNNRFIKNDFFQNNPISFDPSLYNTNYIMNDSMINCDRLSQIDEYDEVLADKFMYDEIKFKEDEPKDIIYNYEKASLKSQGMKMLFTKLQKNPKNRNTRIKKTKSGKCYIYVNKEWMEEKLQKIITKICCNLCDLLYDKETSINHFIRLVIGGQPKRLSALRKHIEEEIIKLNEIEKHDNVFEQNQIKEIKQNQIKEIEQNQIKEIEQNQIKEIEPNKIEQNQIKEIEQNQIKEIEQNQIKEIEPNKIEQNQIKEIEPIQNEQNQIKEIKPIQNVKQIENDEQMFREYLEIKDII